jgi:hypothetical protein
MLRDALRKYRNADGAPGGGTPPAPAADPAQNPPTDGLTFEAWKAGLDEAKQALIDGHVSGAMSALKKERQARADLEKKVTELAKTAEAGSALEKQLGELQSDLAEATRRASFMEGAQANGCTAPDLAYMAAREGGHFDANGRPNWEALKAAQPILFATQKPAPGGSGDAGRGTQQTPKTNDMNSFIRQSAGRT